MEIKQFKLIRKNLMNMYDNAQFILSSGLTKDKLDKDIRKVYQDSLNENIPYQLVRAKAFAYALNNCQIALTQDDLFVGIFNLPNTLVQLRQQRRVKIRKLYLYNYQETFKYLQTNSRGAVQLDISHVSPDWESLLSLGFVGILNRAKEAYSKNPSIFFESVIIVYDAVIKLLKRIAEISQQQGRTDLAELMFALINRPPQTLHEALELSFIYHELQWFEGQPVRSMGIFDRLYRPFYQKDLATGRLTVESAEELLKMYFCRYPAYSKGKMWRSSFLFRWIITR